MRVLGRLSLVLALLVAFFVSVTKLGDRTPDEVPDKGPPVDSATTLESISLDGDFDDELTDPATPDARYVVLRDDVSTTGAPDLAAIRAANPGADILVYKNAAFTLWDPEADGVDSATGEPNCPFAPFQGSGVDYCVADGHEDWFLHSAADPSVRLTSTGYAGQWAMNPANEEYRDTWTTSVLQRLQDADRDGIPNEGPDDRYDGVYIDDVNVRPGHGLVDTGIAEAPVGESGILEDVPAYREGMVGFIDETSNAIRDEGFLTMTNVDGDILDESQREAALEIAGDVDIYNQERFIRLFFSGADGSGDILSTDPSREGTPPWSSVIGFMSAVQATGASFAGISYGRDSGKANVEAQRYIRASFLLGWDGTDGGALAYRSLDDTPGGPLGLPDWTASIGVPEGGIEPVGSAYRKVFSEGMAVVNPTLDTDAEVTLGGAYELPDGSCPETVTLGPVEGLVLPRC